MFAAMLVAGLLACLPADAQAAGADYAVPGGWFYSQAGGGTGKGFGLLDSGLDSRGQLIRFYSEFNRLGGAPVLGYPASDVFSLPDGFTYQATQAALMQWRAGAPGGGQVQLANTFDMLSQAGHDQDLQSLGIPPPIPDDGSGANYAKAVPTRLAWLTQPAIKARFLANPNPGASEQWTVDHSIQLYGLPTSLPQRSGPFIVQRFQRVSFQLWLDSVPGQPPPGSVVPVLGGDLAKLLGLVPASAQVPQPPLPANASQPRPPVQAMPALQPAIALLEQYDQAHNTGYMNNLADHHVSVALAPLSDPGALGFFSPDDNTIRISSSVSNEDVHDLADLISHESSHALDYWTGVDIISTQGCYNTEVKAFRHQSDVWQWFYPNLKPPPVDQLDQFLNSIVGAVTGDPTGFVQRLMDVYHHQCTGQ